MTNTDRDKLDKRVVKALALLRGHFDSVQILATKTVDDTTTSFSKGCGDWYARCGMARAFLIEDQLETEQARGNELRVWNSKN